MRLFVQYVINFELIILHIVPVLISKYSTVQITLLFGYID